MCYRATCNKCNKPTYKGCGRHVEQVLSDVPEEHRCSCPVEEEEPLEVVSESKMSKVIHLSDADFQRTVDTAEVPVLVDFSASWCGPCKTLFPIIDKLASDLDGEALVCKVDVDEAPVTASHFKIRSVPAILLFIKGQKVNEHVGLATRDKLLRMLGKDPATLEEKRTSATRPEMPAVKA